MGVKEIIVECSKCKKQSRYKVPVFVDLQPGTEVVCGECAAKEPEKDSDEK